MDKTINFIIFSECFIICDLFSTLSHNLRWTPLPLYLHVILFSHLTLDTVKIPLVQRSLPPPPRCPVKRKCELGSREFYFPEVLSGVVGIGRVVWKMWHVNTKRYDSRLITILRKYQTQCFYVHRYLYFTAINKI
jgi:hypothetical protein